MFFSTNLSHSVTVREHWQYRGRSRSSMNRVFTYAASRKLERSCIPVKKINKCGQASIILVQRIAVNLHLGQLIFPLLRDVLQLRISRGFPVTTVRRGEHTVTDGITFVSLNIIHHSMCRKNVLLLTSNIAERTTLSVTNKVSFKTTKLSKQAAVCCACILHKMPFYNIE